MVRVCLVKCKWAAPGRSAGGTSLQALSSYGSETKKEQIFGMELSLETAFLTEDDSSNSRVFLLFIFDVLFDRN